MVKHLLAVYLLTLFSLTTFSQNTTPQDSNPYSYDVTSDPEASSANVLQILQKLPYIVVNASGEIYIGGLSDNTICVDGFPQKLTEVSGSAFLSTMSASRVERIEIRPSRKASDQTLGDGGIINIVTRQQKTDGITLEATAQGATSTLFGGNVLLNAKYKKFFLNGSYAYAFQNFTKMETNRTSHYYDPYYDYQSNSYSNSTERLRDNDAHNASIHTGVWLSDKDMVGASFNLFLSSGEAYTQQTSYVDIHSSLGAQAIYNLDANTKSYNLAAYYKHLFKQGATLTFTYEYGRNKDKTENLLYQTSDSQYMILSSIARNKPDEHAARFDLFIPFNERNSLEAGARYSKLDTEFRRKEYTALRDGLPSWDMQVPSYSTGKISFSETYIPFDSERWTAYAQYNLKLSRFRLGVGVHWELPYDMYYTFDESFALYPFLNMGYKFNDKDNLAFNYTIQRSSPNPIQSRGWLGHQWLQKFNLNYRHAGKKTQWMADILYQNSANSFLLNNDVVVVVKDNFDEFDRYASECSFQQVQFSLNARHQISKSLYLNGLGMLGYRDLDERDNGGGGIYGQLSGGADLLLPSDFCLAANGGYYFSPEIDGFKSMPNYFYRLNLSREFLQKQLAVTVYATDFFGKKKLKIISEHDESFHKATTRYTFPTNEFGVSVTYRFHK